MTAAATLTADIDRLSPLKPEQAPDLIELLLRHGSTVGASDLHLLPTETDLTVLARIDGVLAPVITLPKTVAPNLVARLKVLAELLTYRTEVPQEGRIRGRGLELRVSTFPTLHGEKAVIRYFTSTTPFRRLTDLGLPTDVHERLLHLIEQTAGAIVATGPAGSGKSTTIYACLREIADRSGQTKSLVSIEDPVEVVVDGVAQSQVNPALGFTLATGLRSLLRQDPDVLLVGEIRDPSTAVAVFQACLTGHLVLTTFHAGSACEAISRLIDMGIEPYLLRSGLLAVVCQRLLRRLCHCRQESRSADDHLGLPLQRTFLSAGCERCNRTGYSGRILIAELLDLTTTAIDRTILAKADAHALERQAIDAGMRSRWCRVLDAIEHGHTSPLEARRVFGPGAWPEE